MKGLGGVIFFALSYLVLNNTTTIIVLPYILFNDFVVILQLAVLDSLKDSTRKVNLFTEEKRLDDVKIVEFVNKNNFVKIQMKDIDNKTMKGIVIPVNSIKKIELKD